MFASSSEESGRIRETFECPRCGCIITSEEDDRRPDAGSIED
jgi:hypothetical protein